MIGIARLAYAIVDGTLIPIDRIANQKPYYSVKHRRHRVNTRVIVDPAVRLKWISPVLRGSTHDQTAAREHGIIEALSAAQAMTLPVSTSCSKNSFCTGWGRRVALPCWAGS
jgi:hypothetical protein